MEKSSDPVILNDKPIHCLMYADDIILLSTSAPGLQEKIDILGKLCDDWCLTVNTQKTKIMVFNNAGRLSIMCNLNSTILYLNVSTGANIWV